MFSKATLLKSGFIFFPKWKAKKPHFRGTISKSPIPTSAAKAYNLQLQRLRGVLNTSDLDEAGWSAGINSSPTGQVNVTGLESFYSQCDEVLNPVGELCDNVVSALGHEHKRITHDIEQNPKERLIQDHLKASRESIERVKSQKVQKLLDTADVLTSKRDQVGEAIQQSSRKLVKIQGLYYNHTPTRFFYDTNAGYLLVLSFIFTLEIFINLRAILLLGEGANILGLLAVLVISLLVALFAHKGGFAVRFKKYGEASAAMLIGLATCVVVFILRLGLENQLVLSSLNIVVFSSAVFFAWKKAENHVFFSAMRVHKKLSNCFNRLTLKAGKLRRKAEKNNEVIDGRYLKKAEVTAQEEIFQLDSLKRFCEAEDERVEIFLANRVREIEIIRARAESRFWAAVNGARASKGMEPIIPPKKPGFDPDSMNPSSNGNEPVKPRQPIGFKQGLKKAAAVALPLIFLFSACSTPASTDIAVVVDRTPGVDSLTLPDTARFAALVAEMGEVDIGHAVRVSFTTIDATPDQLVQVVEIPAAGNFLLRNEKEYNRKLIDFKARVGKELASLAVPKEGFRRSYINRCLCRQLEELSASTADRKVLLLFSDMIENGLVSFYNYRNDPSRLMTSYEQIAEALSADCLLPALDSIEIIVIHSAREEEYELTEQSRRLWQKYVESKGGRISYRTSL